MAYGRKTGGRKAGTPNKDNPLKGYLRMHSLKYFEPSVAVEDAELAEKLHCEVGDVVSMFELDLSAMSADDRASIQEKILRYHQPQMQSVSAEVALQSDSVSLEVRLAELAE